MPFTTQQIEVSTGIIGSMYMEAQNCDEDLSGGVRTDFRAFPGDISPGTSLRLLYIIHT